jgi:membrane AbrB-like protein
LKKSLSPASRRRAWNLAETMLVAGVGGAAFEATGLPAGLVAGSVLAVAAMAVLGRPMMMPANLTRAVLVIVGIALGSVITPSTIAGLAAYPQSIALLLVASFAIMLCTGYYLRAVHGWTGLSALLGASPGALAQAIALSIENDVDIVGVTVVQTMRLVFLAAGLPIVFAFFGMSAPAVPSGAVVHAGSLLDLAVLCSLSTLAAVLLFRIGFPGGWLFGAMIASAALHGFGLTEAQLPRWISAAAVVALGAVTGSRLAGTAPRLLVRYFAAGCGSFAVSTSIAAAFVLLAVYTLGVPVTDTAVAFAPGAQETMMLLALALRLDPVFVGAHHIARYFFVSVTIPILAAAVTRRERRKS